MQAVRAPQTDSACGPGNWCVSREPKRIRKFQANNPAPRSASPAALAEAVHQPSCPEGSQVSDECWSNSLQQQNLFCSYSGTPLSVMGRKKDSGTSSNCRQSRITGSSGGAFLFRGLEEGEGEEKERFEPQEELAGTRGCHVVCGSHSPHAASGNTGPTCSVSGVKTQYEGGGCAGPEGECWPRAGPAAGRTGRGARHPNTRPTDARSTCPGIPGAHSTVERPPSWVQWWKTGEKDFSSLVGGDGAEK